MLSLITHLALSLPSLDFSGLLSGLVQISFQFLVYFFVLVTSLLAVGVPVVYALGDEAQVRTVLEKGAIVWGVMLVLVTGATFLVV